MSRAQRLTFLGIAAVIAIVAVVLLVSSGSGNDDETEASGTQSNATATATATATSENMQGAEPTSTPEETQNEPPLPVLEKGKVSKIRVKQGETVAFTVHVDQPDEVHVHGYDIEKEVAPGKDTKISFKADITGIFDIELHSTDEQIAQLRVDPD
jgi:FtsP/CotA-like multicopper oxidase with cupredoxin domain